MSTTTVGSAVQGGDSAEILRMQAGVKAWVSRVARDRTTALHQLSPAALLSLSGAAALSPLIGAGAGVTGALSVAGIGVLSSLGGGVLSGELGTAYLLDAMCSIAGRSLTPQEWTSYAQSVPFPTKPYAVAFW